MKPCLLQTHQYLFPTWYRGRRCTLYGNQSSTSYGAVPGRYGGNRGTLYGHSRQTDYMNGYVAANSIGIIPIVAGRAVGCASV
jgi:hypothetical protein